ncbi:MAG: arylsulfatase, partial [Verrucomicrobia bacterium]|nr:arylsulfatase [Verrucomicrobiota bacterium]
GYGDMSCYGNPFLVTPETDRLYASSVRFADFHVDPICSPTRAALMTGRYSSRTGVWLTYAGRHYLRRDEITMADVFSDNGYRTAIFGKWHLGDNYPFRPVDRGFDESLVFGSGVIGEAPDYWGNDYYDDVYLRNGEPEQAQGYCTDVWFDETMRFAESNREQPFFVYLPTNSPHGPHHVPRKYVEPYLDREDIPASRAWFYGMCANIDENIGRLRRRLEELGIADHTILVFLTDNGTAAGAGTEEKSGLTSNGYNAGMRGKKGMAYEGGHRAACFMHWPGGGLDEARDVEPVASHMDLFPTLIDLCGMQAPADLSFDGDSLVPLLRGASEPWPERRLFIHNQGRFGEPVNEGLPIKYKDYCVLSDRWRMVCGELYDIKADPGQQHDLAAQHPDIVEQFTQAYEAWWEDVSRRFDEYCPIVVDQQKQATTVLTCQGWHGDVIPYNQQQVRAGLQGNGYWVIDVVRKGLYEIELRRWPEELDEPIGALVSLGELDADKLDVESRLFKLPSRAIHAVRARLAVGAFDRTVEVASGDKAVRFQVELEAGEQRLQTWFTDHDGESWGAYYVYMGAVLPQG